LKDVRFGDRNGIKEKAGARGRTKPHFLVRSLEDVRFGKGNGGKREGEGRSGGK